MKNENNIKERYIHYAANLVLAYKGDEPFHLYLKSYFKSHKKHGSRDRKSISSLCYNYFRLGSGVIMPMSLEEKILLGNSVAGDKTESLEERLQQHHLQFNYEEIFPLNNQLSSEIDQKYFNRSFMEQPLLFIRIRPGHEKNVAEKLAFNHIPFNVYSHDCISVDNTTSLESLLNINKEVVIQDKNSQGMSLFLKLIKTSPLGKINIWDACAASGGKSIQATDYFSKISLTVTDKRKSILKNLQKRFGHAGITDFRILQADLSKPVDKLHDEPFDLIIADVPCSGSGTWARTPEQLHFFQDHQLDEYATLQKMIVSNCISKLKPGGYLLYITCSVFAKENEENVRFFCKNKGLKLVHTEYLKGYDMQADTLYGALLQPA